MRITKPLFLNIRKSVEREITTPPHLHNALCHSFLTKAFLAIASVVAIMVTAGEARAQQLGVKTNILYDATASINLGVEYTVAPRWSIDLSGDYNAWTFGHGKRWKHWFLQPEARYWLCDATVGHFVALHALGGKYNVGHIGAARDLLGYNFSALKDHRYQGWMVGAGVAYGYSWMLNKHWNIEAELGIGWIHTKYDKFECKGCGRKVGKGHKNFVSPTKAAVNLVYVF